MKSDSEITVRLASTDDAVAIQSLVVDLATAIDQLDKVSSTAEDFREALSSSEPEIHALLVERDRQPVGLAIFFLTFSTWRGNKGVYLQDIYLHPDMRGTGAGKKLMARVIAWSVEKGADHLRLSVDIKNTSAQLFYESVGMTLCDKEMIYQISDMNFEELGAFR